MKAKKILMLVLVVVLLSMQAAFAQGSLSAELSGEILRIRWSAQGNCVLTVYRDGWPITVCNVDGASGGTEIAVQRGGKYSVRLRTMTGCETAEAVECIGENIEATKEPVAMEPTKAPATAAPTRTPANETATPEPTAEPTAAPTIQVTSAPIQRPTATPVVSVPPQSGQTMADMAAQVVSEVNAERAKYGLQPLSVSSQLTSAACIRANEIAELFSHTRPDGTSWSTVSSEAKGENIAKGQNSAERVMAAWMSSEGHRENILRESFGSIGVCALRVNGVIHWVQLFGR